MTSKQDLSITFLQGVLLQQQYSNKVLNQQTVQDFIFLCCEIGYVFNQDTIQLIQCQSEETLVEILNILVQTKGNHVKHQRLIDNFPCRVKDYPSNFYTTVMSVMSLCGDVYLHEDKEDQLKNESLVKPVMLKSITDQDFEQLLKRFLESKDSIPPNVLSYIQGNVQEHIDTINNSNIVFKETLAYITAYLFNKGLDIEVMLKVRTMTDVLRMLMVCFTGSSVITHKFKMKSLSRPTRRSLCKIIESVYKDEDLKKYKDYWIHICHGLHVGQYKKHCPQLFMGISHVRDNKNIATKSTIIEQAFREYDYSTLMDIMSYDSDPTRFIRSLVNVLEKFPLKRMTTLTYLKHVLSNNNVNSKLLLQTLEQFINIKRGQTVHKVYTKNGMYLYEKQSPISMDVSSLVIEILEQKLKYIYSTRDTFNGTRPVIDSDGHDVALPKHMRTSTSGLDIIGRGSRVPLSFGEDDILRVFLYWKGDDDIDLSVKVFGENFEYVTECTFHQLNHHGLQHSGDVRSAPNGGSEFIDIDLSMLPKKALYVSVICHNYYGQPFSETEECFVGLMCRTKEDSEQVFDPKTVLMKFDLTGTSNKSHLSGIIDLESKKYIVCDDDYGYIDNNSISVTDEIFDVELRYMKYMTGHKFLTLSDVLNLYPVHCKGVTLVNSNDVSFINSKVI